MRRAVTVSLAFALLAGCADQGGSIGEITTLREAARAGEQRYGVPAGLTLAVAYTETRFQLPDASAEASHDMPPLVGVGGLRPWLAIDPVRLAASELGVHEDTLRSDPALSLLGTAAVLRALAEQRGEVPASDDPGAWAEVLGDYAGLANEGARHSYAHEVFRWMTTGVDAVASNGEEVVLRSQVVRMPDGVGASRQYTGAEYPLARWVPASSSNYSSRGGTAIDHVIIHTTQGSYAGTISWFQNPAAEVSAHYVVRSSDGEITQMVHEADKAWHAGNINSRSIGIEHEGYVDAPDRWYTDAMYRSSAALTRYICDKYHIPIDRSHIIGHYEAPGATHTDPGPGWDWDRYMALVRSGGATTEYDASYSDRSIPAEMTSGDRAVAWIEMQNDGSATWSLDTTRLGTSSPEDHPSPFYDVENWINDHRATAPDHTDYSTGTVGRFTFMLTAPEVTEETTITDTFRLVEEGETWFGEEVTVSVLVHPRAGGATDGDGDGSAAGADCDDADPSVHPGATDVCGDGVDADCDGADATCDPGADGGGLAGDSDAGVPGGSTTLSGGCSIAPRSESALGMIGCAIAALALVIRRRPRR